MGHKKKTVTIQQACLDLSLLKAKHSGKTNEALATQYLKTHQVGYSNKSGKGFYSALTVAKKFGNYEATGDPMNLRRGNDAFVKQTAPPKVLNHLKRKKHHLTLKELAQLCEQPEDVVMAEVIRLKQAGYNIIDDVHGFLLSPELRQSSPQVLNITEQSTNHYRFGAVGDNHLASKYERLDVLNALYDRFSEEGITDVFNTGNWIDGEARFNKHDLKCIGLDNQIQYFLSNYPQREGITTHVITGDDHEGWYTQREGVDVGKYMQLLATDPERGMLRPDLKYIGHMEQDIILKAQNGETVLRVLHPGGGSAYALSYSVQKIVESYQGGEKPHILLVGHYHKAEYSYVRGVHVVQTGCTQDQTPFMRKKKLAAHLGGWIIDFSTDDNGAVTRFKQEFFPFYDNAYYQKKWAYKWG